MFTMIQLHIVLLFCCYFNVSCQELSTTPKVPPLQPCSRKVITNEDLRVQIAHQNTRFSQYYTRLEQQNTRIEKQNTKFAVQDVKISDQNTKLAEQNITILEQNIKIKNLEMKIEELVNVIGQENQPSSRNNSTSQGTGSIFTRWGRRDCPGTISQLVYSGKTGGSHYKHTGGAAEYVCLPPDPTWNVNKHFKSPHWGHMYGTEYQNVPNRKVDYKGPYGGYMYGTEYQAVPNRKVDYKVPCAVCRTSQFSTVLMIPARSECYQGWQEAYHGELVSGKHDHEAASQYVCLDRDPQIDDTDTNYDAGNLIYPVRAICGALPCPPYENNTLLTCVVCLK